MTTKTAKKKTTKTKTTKRDVPEDNWKPVTPKKPIAGVSECPRGGNHAWETDEDGTKACSKCHEPAPTRAKAASPAKPAAKAKTAKPDAKAAKPKPNGEKKMSAIDAAYATLKNAIGPMNCPALIEAMASTGLWKSPGGATPAATLHAAICREIASKGKDSRFAKDGRGTFKAIK